MMILPLKILIFALTIMIFVTVEDVFSIPGRGTVVTGMLYTTFPGLPLHLHAGD